MATGVRHLTNILLVKKMIVTGEATKTARDWRETMNK